MVQAWKSGCGGRAPWYEVYAKSDLPNPAPQAVCPLLIVSLAADY